MNCKECLYERVCPIHLNDEDAERCKTYEGKEDYVKVVRCKDCIHRGYADDGWCGLQARYTDDSEYCSLGIRKEATGEN